MKDSSIDHIFFFSKEEREELFELTSGQRYIWRIMQLLKSKVTYNVPMIFELPNDVDLQVVKQKISLLMERHEGLRTTFPLSADGFPKQRVHGEGAVAVSVRETSADDEDSVVRETNDHFQTTHFNLEQELPLRCAIVCVDGIPRQLVFSFSHMIMDNWSWSLLRHELSEALDNAMQDREEHRAWSPVDQAIWERSAAGEKLLRMSIKYWGRVLERFPRAMHVHKATEPAPNRWQSAELRSASLGVAMRLVAAKAGVSTATVLLTAFGLVLGRRNRTATFSTSVLCVNRSTRNLEQSIGSYVQLVPVVFDLSADDASELLKNAHYTLLEAYTNALAWPPDIIETARAIERRRGIEIDLDTYFNIAHPLLDDDTIDTKHRDEKRPVGGDVKLDGTVSPMAEWEFDIHTVTVRSFSSENIYIRADTKYISEEDISQILLSVEETIISIANLAENGIWKLKSAPKSNVDAQADSWVFIDNTWIDLDEVTSFFTHLDDVAHCAVFPDKEQDHLTLYCVLRNEGIISSLLNAPYDKLFLERSTIVPHKFIRLHKAPIGDLTVEQSWRDGLIAEVATWDGSNSWHEKRSGHSLPR